MAVDPATRMNGCMQFIPGTHRLPIETHGVYSNSIHREIRRERVQECIDRHGLEHIELAPGCAVVWHSNLYHYSPPNTSDHGRIAVAGVYTTPELAGQNAMHRRNFVVMENGKICTQFPATPYASTLEPIRMPPAPSFEEPAAVGA
jgi:ectoine hydroxylase-related dioxygenase (phytanoyl-CoA dioxygenase family)